MRRLLLVSTLTCAVAAGVFAQAPRSADIKTPDGLVLKASYFPAGKPGPGIVLFHQCSIGATRHLWDGLATSLAAAGIHVVTFDNRGFGETAGEMAPPPPPPRGGRGPILPAGMQMAGASSFPRSDAEAALTFLKSQKDVDSKRLAAGGSSCGATEAGDLAMRHTEIKAIVLMSGLPSPGGVAYTSATPRVAVFGIYSTEDQGASSLRAAMALSKDPQSTLKMYPGAEHGVALFTSHAELQPELVKWLQARLQ